jgi:hypothetical protein
MQIKYDSASMSGRGIALPELREFRPARETRRRPATPAEVLWRARLEVIRGQTWETAAWLAVAASTLVAIGMSLLP